MLNHFFPSLRNCFLGIFFLVIIAACQNPSQTEDILSFDPIDYVDPFIGTGAHGHTTPGATVPFGMVQLCPDTHLDGWEASSGYHYDDPAIYGFSHTHLSGTGIGDMGDILVLPFTGPISNELKANFSKEKEKASPGYYQVEFDNYKVGAELTTTDRVGFHRYTYGDATEKKLMLDLGHILQSNWGHRSIAGKLEIVDDKTIRGHRVSSGWAHDHPVYFYAVFSQAFKIIDVTDDGQKVDLDNDQVEGAKLKVFLDFADNPSLELLIKVGISSVDEAGAQKNLEAELPVWDFDATRATAEQAWREKLQALAIESKYEKVLTNFYTAFYHTMFSPMLFQDVDGRYRGMDKKIHQAKPGQTNYTVFSLWDTFRALHPLMSIVEEEKTVEWVNALLQKYEEGGMLPKWPLAANYTGTMVGYPAVSVIADALSKNFEGIDVDLALKAAITSSEYHPEIAARSPEPRAKAVMSKHIDFLNRMDYIPADSIEGSVSYGLECAYYDWCIAQIALKAGDRSAIRKYEERAKAYRKYFDPGTGFMRGKMADGSWRTPFSPYYSDHDYGDYIEGNAWQWSWFVPHEIEGLTYYMGGKDSLGAKLDSLFTASGAIEGERASADISGLIGQYAHGNEPSHHIAYLYHYADQPWKTQERIDEILQTLYTPTPDGISGNEDCGQMSAWYVLNALGFYQICPGDPVYTVGRPLVDGALIKQKSGTRFKITVENNSLENKYVDEVYLNGIAQPELTFPHSAIRKGGFLRIVMSDRPKRDQ
jgi:predicted alpha-1,2-mannosidase